MYLNSYIWIDVRPIFTTQSPGYCPSNDWISYEKNCYYIERIPRTYGEAKFDCSNKGNLVFKSFI